MIACRRGSDSLEISAVFNSFVNRSWSLSAFAVLLLSSTGAAGQGTTESPAVGPEAEQATSEPPAKPVVVSPELEHYEPPVYPKEAFAEGLQAEVKLLITVQADGSVVDPEVVETQGNGFDEAAMAAALLLRFRPATVDGEARAVRIGFQYSFTIDEREEVVPEEVPTFGQFSGQVLISGTETPLPGVEVSLVDGTGNVYPATTDAEGRFLLEGLPAGKYRFRAAAEGFLARDTEEEVFAGEEVQVIYRLSAETSGIEVVVTGERPPREMTRRVLERREILRIPGSSGDALRSIQSLPGVARPPGLAGLLIVRGSAPEDTGTFIDGASVPLIYHFGGLSSVIPPDLLDTIDFYPGNFSVRYGRRMGGIVDVELRKPNTGCYDDYGVPNDGDRCYHGMAQVDLIDGRLLLQGPVPGTDDWSFALAGRRSWVDVFVKPILEGAGTSVTSAPVYYDYQAIVERNKGPNDKLSFRFFGSDDKLALINNNPSAQDPGFGGNLAFGTSFIRGQALYRKQLTRRTNLESIVTVGSQKIDFELGGNLKFTLNSVPIDFRSEIGHRFHKTTKVNVGLDFETGSFDVFVRAPPISRSGEAAPPPLATQVPVESSSSGFTFRPGWYADVEWEPTKRLRLVPGVRLDYARDSNYTDVSPRLVARYSLFLPEDGAWGNTGLTTVLKGGVGKFAQPPQFQETDPVFGTPGVESNKSMHYSLGFEQGLTTQIDLSVEGYYKDYYNQVSSSNDPNGAFLYGNNGSGSVVGMETLLKYRPDERFFGWVAYTLSRSVRKQCPTCEENLFAYDQTHNLIILGSYRLGRGWEIGGRFRIVSGPLVTPVASDTIPAIFAGDAGSYVPLQGQPNSERLPLFHQLDVRIDKRWVFRTWQLSTYLDVQNTYNYAAAEANLYNYNYSQTAYQTGLPIIPSLGVRGEF